MANKNKAEAPKTSNVKVAAKKTMRRERKYKPQDMLSKTPLERLYGKAQKLPYAVFRRALTNMTGHDHNSNVAV
ncbi:hypothetical protein, partial [Parvimonas sp. M13]